MQPGPALRSAFVAALWLACLAFAPSLALVLVAFNGFLLLGLFGGRISAAGIEASPPQRTERADEPFISIHVPTCNEPPGLVVQTLEALRRIEYASYEVIVLDNNTSNEAFWKPVERYCAEAGPRFRFLHIAKLEGYKAGALNVARTLTASEAEFILVIDADYRVEPSLLREALAYFSDDEVALVQFPQAYLNVSGDNEGLRGDYAHFFQVYMNLANRLNSVLSTGTVSVLRKDALDAVGGWSDRTITEDAEVGLRLKKFGYRTAYVPSVLGRGLMPSDLAALRSQRERWAYGNAQTLMSLVGDEANTMSLRQLVGVVLQLTAWFNLLLLPIVTLIGTSALMLVSPHPLYEEVALVSIASIWLHLVFQFAFYLLALREEPLRSSVSAYLVHLGLLWEGGISWVRCLLGNDLGFKRTNKFLKTDVDGDLIPSLSIFVLVAASGLVLGVTGSLVLGLAALFASPAFLTVLFVRQQVRTTHRISEAFHTANPDLDATALSQAA